MSGLVSQDFLATAILLSMGYIGFGKRAAAIEECAHSGLNFSLIFAFFHSAVFLHQHLASCIGLVYEKNLPQVAAEMSMMASYLAMILGVACGIGLSYAVDFITSIIFAAFISLLIPVLLILLDLYKLESLYIGISGFTLFLHMIGLFLSHYTYAEYSSLNLDSILSIMALLGATITPHNFYIHSSIAQLQRRLSYFSIGGSIYNQWFAIICNLIGTFLPHYVLMSLASEIFDKGVFLMPATRDDFSLMDQILGNLLPYFLLFCLCSMITILTLSNGGHVLLHELLGINMQIWVHHVILKFIAITSALYYIQCAGAEGIYQLLLYCQTISAMLFPASAVLLFNFSLSSYILGSFSVSWPIESFSFVTFLVILTLSIIFLLEIFSGNYSLIDDLGRNMEDGETLTSTLLLIFTSLVVGFCLEVIPLRPPINQPLSRLQKGKTEQTTSKEETHSGKSICTKHQSLVTERSPEDFLGCHSDKTMELDAVPTATFSEYAYKYVFCSTSNAEYPSHTFHIEKECPVVHIGLSNTPNEMSSGDLRSTDISEREETDSSVKNEAGDDGNMQNEKHTEHKEVLVTSLTPDIPRTSTNVIFRGDSTSRKNGKPGPTGLTRGGRSRFSSILDEFWGHIFDLHGKLTEEAASKRGDILLGLDFESASVSPIAERVRKPPPKFSEGMVYGTTLGNYNSPMQQWISSVELPNVMKMEAPDLSANRKINSSELYEKCNKQYSRMISEVPCAITSDGSFLDQLLFPSFSECAGANYSDQYLFTLGKDGFNSSSTQYIPDFSRKYRSDVLVQPTSLNLFPESIWSEPSLQMFTTTLNTRNGKDATVTNIPGTIEKFFPNAETINVTLRAFRFCIVEFLKLEGSSWLFTQNGGCDEKLIDQIAAMEWNSFKEVIGRVDQTGISKVDGLTNFQFSVPGCGDSCIRKSSLIVSFGVWSIRRIMELLLVENIRGLWCKYTYVLNRLQGIIGPAFCKPRSCFSPCRCLALPETHKNRLQKDKGSQGGDHYTTASSILEIIKNVEGAISERTGPKLPKAEIIVNSVLNRYKLNETTVVAC